VRLIAGLAAFAMSVLGASAEPASAGWLLAGFGQASSRTASDAPRQPASKVANQSAVEGSGKASVSAPGSAYAALIAQHASANGVPASLIHRVIMRESRYNPRAVSGGNYGLMQIRVGTARAMGYSGPAAGLLDPETNVTYAVRYLAGAYRAAHGNEARALALYMSGYYGKGF
jgi:soluble lytic murein transglycosylase-like protein